MSWASAEEAYNAVLSKARSLRRLLWKLPWHLPLALSIAAASGVDTSDIRVAEHPAGPVIIPATAYLPKAAMAYQLNDSVLKTFTRVVDGFTPATVDVRALASEYRRARMEALLEAATVFMRIDALADVEPKALVKALPVYEPRSLELRVDKLYVESLEYPEGYSPVEEDGRYLLYFTGTLTWLNMGRSDLPDSWYTSENEQPYISVYLGRGRCSVKASDQSGNMGTISDQGVYIYVANGVDVPVRVHLPVVASVTLQPGEAVLYMNTPSWTIRVRWQGYAAP